MFWISSPHEEKCMSSKQELNIEQKYSRQGKTSRNICIKFASSKDDCMPRSGAELCGIIIHQNGMWFASFFHFAYHLSHFSIQLAA